MTEARSAVLPAAGHPPLARLLACLGQVLEIAAAAATLPDQYAKRQIKPGAH